MRSCAAQKRMKITHDKIVSSKSVFFAPMRFRLQRFISLKKISFLSHNTGCRHDRTNMYNRNQNRNNKGLLHKGCVR